MVCFSSVFGATFLLLLAVGPRSSAALSEPDLCAYDTPTGSSIHLELKPSLNSTISIPKTLNITDAKCCLNPLWNCTLPRPLTLTLDNVVSHLEYPIRPASVAVNKREMWDGDFRDEIWYSLYEFEEPYLNQSLDVHLTFDQPDEVTQGVSARMNLKNRFKLIEHTESSTGLFLRARRLLGGDETDLTNKLLLIPEAAAGDSSENTQPNGDSGHSLVLARPLSDGFPGDRVGCDKACNLSVDGSCAQRQSTNVTRVFRGSLSRDEFGEYQFGRALNQTRMCSLDSYRTLNDPHNISRDRKRVTFNSWHSVLLVISMSSINESNVVDGTSPLDDLTMKHGMASNTMARSISRFVYLSHVAATNYILSTMLYTIRGYADNMTRIIEQRYRGFLDPFIAKWSSAIDGYFLLKGHLHYVIYTFEIWLSVTKYIKHTLASLEDLWLSFVAHLGDAMDGLLATLCSCIALDRIPVEKSVDHRWNIIWSSTSVDAIENDTLNGALYNIEPTTLLVSALVNKFTAFLITLTLVMCLGLGTCKTSPKSRGPLASRDDAINTTSIGEDHDTVSTDTEDTEDYCTPPQTPRVRWSSIAGTNFRIRLNAFLTESASCSSLPRLLEDQPDYDSDYMLDRCLSERDITLIKFRKKKQRSIVTLSYIASALRDHGVCSATKSDTSITHTISTEQSDSYEESLSSVSFSSHMLSLSVASSSTSLPLPPASVISASVISLSSSGVNPCSQSSIRSDDDHPHGTFNIVVPVTKNVISRLGVPSREGSSPGLLALIVGDNQMSCDGNDTANITEVPVATGDAPDVVPDDLTPAVHVQTFRRMFADVADVDVIANATSTDLPLIPDDLLTEITEQITGTGNLPNGLLYPNLEEAFICLALTFFKHHFVNRG